MADTKLVDLDPGNAEGTDIVYAVKDPSGVPLDRKIALSNIKDYILGGSPPTFTDAITVRSTDTGANAAPDVILYRDSASPADNDTIGQIKFDGEDSAGNQQTYGTITGQILDEASTSEDGALLFGVVTAGTVANEVRLDGTALSPVTSDGNALGTASLQWANLYVGSIELGNASDTTLTRSSGGDVAVEGNVVYRAGGTDVALADGGTGASLTDPNADRIMFWDDSAGKTEWLEPKNGLSIVGTTLVPAREVLTANRTYYVGSNIPTPTITIATPAVVTSTAHGLSAGAAVVFNVPQNTTQATISAADPAVITMTNTFAAGRPVSFRSTGSLPIPLVQGTTYYVIATGLSGSSFQVSDTVGGAAINTSAPTATFTNGSANISITNANTYLAVGNTVRFATTGGLPTNFATGTDYFVVSATSTLITVSATNGGTAIVAGSAGTGTQTVLQSGTHFVSTAGALPTGVTAGTTYYVIDTGLTANDFRISTTVGGAAVNTSGSVTGSPIYGAYTGSNSNNGLTNTAGGAFLTVNHAYSVIVSTIDTAGYTVTIQLADGTYTGSISLASAYSGGGQIIINGNSTNPGNVIVSTTSTCINLTTAVAKPLIVRHLTVTNSSGSGIRASGAGANIEINNIRFGACSNAHLDTASSALISATGNYSITGSAAYHVYAQTSAIISVIVRTITLTGTPAFSGVFAVAQNRGTVNFFNNTWSGSATGARAYAANFGHVNVFGAGNTHLPGNAGNTIEAASYGLFT